MATYAELLSALDNEALLAKIRVAIWVAADAVRAEDTGTINHANRLLWAKAALQNPDSVAKQMVPIVLAQNRSATLAEIVGATDAQVQTAVNTAVNVFATG
jgi:hypothetical protein